MSHLHRFVIPPQTPEHAPLTLEGEEAHHALRVVRVQAGDRIALMDGTGREILGRVTHCHRRSLEIAPEQVRQLPPPRPRLTVAMGWLHRAAPVEFAIRHGTEIGVDRFVFFRAHHSERAPQPGEKWARIAAEACKQSGRLWFPQFTVLQDLNAVLAEAAGPLLLASREGGPVPHEALAEVDSLTLIIGPEGDFSPEEQAAARAAGALSLRLTDTVLRSEVAAVAGAVLLLAATRTPRSTAGGGVH
jgi:16S rRNA (uracil1498-N3)-methyltransferase